MILKRQERDSVIKAMYDSSNILASTYNTQTRDLVVIFKGGKQYKYPSVLDSDYTRFELAESQGKVFNSHIKKYAFEKLDDIDEAKLLTEISSAKAKEVSEAFIGIQNRVISELTYITGVVADGKTINLRRLVIFSCPVMPIDGSESHRIKIAPE
jgi:hypothetical protein